MLRTALRAVVTVGRVGLQLYAIMLGVAIVLAILSAAVVIVGRLMGYNW